MILCFHQNFKKTFDFDLNINHSLQLNKFFKFWLEIFDLLDHFVKFRYLVELRQSSTGFAKNVSNGLYVWICDGLSFLFLDLLLHGLFFSGCSVRHEALELPGYWHAAVSSWLYCLLVTSRYLQSHCTSTWQILRHRASACSILCRCSTWLFLTLALGLFRSLWHRGTALLPLHFFLGISASSFVFTLAHFRRIE